MNVQISRRLIRNQPSLSFKQEVFFSDSLKCLASCDEEVKLQRLFLAWHRLNVNFSSLDRSWEIQQPWLEHVTSLLLRYIKGWLVLPSPLGWYLAEVLCHETLQWHFGSALGSCIAV